MLDDTNIAFIGAGVMAEAVIKGLLDGNLVAPARITAADIRPERGRTLIEQYAVAFTGDNRAAVEGAGLVVLSVKPQSLPQALPSISGRIQKGALVLSIVAGAKISTLAEGLAHPAVVRSMPNTPAQIGEGISVWTASASVTDGQRAQARELLGALGEQVYVEEEGYLDAATALSGSGPAYVFLFMEALVEEGVKLGFAPSVARQLVLQTVKGAADYARKSPLDLANLRAQVTSPGGTTEAALRHFEKTGFREAVSQAVQAAYRRSIELGKGT